MSRVEAVLSELGITIDPQLLELAVTHRSWAYEHDQAPHNERLEFLGDAVLGIAVTDYLYNNYPDYPEGRLAKLRAAVVNSRACAEMARALEIGPMLRLGRGEITTRGQEKTSILADTMEAVIGAVYVSAGRDRAERFVHHLFDPLIVDAVVSGAGLDYKTSLQELVSQHDLGDLTYRISESGPDHDKRFEAVVLIGDKRFGSGIGRSKKRAEQIAAQVSFTQLQSETEGE